MKAIASSVGVSVGNLSLLSAKGSFVDAVTLPAYENFQDLILGHENMDLVAGGTPIGKARRFTNRPVNWQRSSICF